MSEFDFHTVQEAVAKLKINYPSFSFVLFCESSHTGLRGIVDLGVHSMTKGFSRHTLVVPVGNIDQTDIDAYYCYFRDMLINQNRLPALINMQVGHR
jgi:hypothetical protein